MSSSAPVEPAMSTAVSNDHSEAVEKSVVIRMRFQGYIRSRQLAVGSWPRLLRTANCQLRTGRGCGGHDVPDHGLRLRLGLHDLQRHLLVSRFERVPRNERILHGLIELHFQRAPILIGGNRRLGRKGAELREI